MLSAHLVQNAQQAEHYFSQDNYYTTDEGFDKSAWAGKGAAMLGLSGGVHREQFMELLNGNVAGQALGRFVVNEKTGEREREHRPGLDLTFSAPKSVSLLAEVAGDEKVSQAHDVAVQRAIAYLERETAQTRTTVGGVTSKENTGNLLVATFRHDTSRELDPQTHTHAVVLNATKCEDGKWRSLSNEEMLRHIKTAGAFYRAELAGELSKLGYEIERTHTDGRFEVKGFTKEQLAHFSQRSGQIEQALADRGKDRRTASTAEKQTAALDTRQAKREVDRAPLRQEWVSRAKVVGIDFDKVPRSKAPTFARESSAELYMRAKDAVNFATQHLSERQASFSVKDLYRHSVEFGTGKTTIEAINKAVKEAKKDGTLIDIDGKRMTTKDAVTAELRMVDGLQRSKGMTAAIVKGGELDKRLKTTEKDLLKEGKITSELNAGQLEAAKLILGSNDRFVGVQGYAGTGKTTMLNVVKELAEKQGYAVYGMAQSASAASTLESETGIKSQTVERFLLERRKEVAKASKELTHGPTSTISKQEKGKPTSRDVAGSRYLEIPATMFRERKLLVARGTVTNSLALGAVDKLRQVRPESIIGKVVHSHALETAKSMVKWERASTTDHVLFRVAEVASNVKGLFNGDAGKTESKQAQPEKPMLWIIDEGSLLSQKDVNRLMAEAEKAGAKVVLTGDSRQLSAVNAGKPFEMMQAKGMQTAEMTEIHRQKTDALKDAVASIIERREQDAFKKLESGLVEQKDTAKLIAQIVSDAKGSAAAEIKAGLTGAKQADNKDTLIITALNEDRRAINDGMRQALKVEGVIQGPAAQAEVLLNRGLTKAQATQAQSYQVSDVVRFGRDYERLGVSRGEYASVSSVDANTGIVNLETARGQKIAWQPQKQSKVEVFKAEARELQAGDKIRFTKNDTDRGVNNGDAAYVQAIKGEKAVIQFKGKSTELELKSAKHWEYAYASTIHASQGKTVDATALHIRAGSGQAMGDRAFYVGATRSRSELRIYTDDKEQALTAVGRTQEKTSALEEIRRGQEQRQSSYSR